MFEYQLNYLMMKVHSPIILLVLFCFNSFNSNAQNYVDFELLIASLQDKNSKETIYTVQLGAFKKDHQLGHFKDVKYLFSQSYDDGFTRFYSSLFKSLPEAVSYRDAMRQEGFPDSFVLGLDGGFDRILIEVD